jgi:tripartite-type tricarboxylate transporter receptor subunit TctC
MGFAQLVAAIPHIESGRLRAIAVTGERRSRFLENAPTLSELGHPELSTTISFGLFAPAATPAGVRAIIQAAALKVQADPAYRARLQRLHSTCPTSRVPLSSSRLPEAGAMG